MDAKELAQLNQKVDALATRLNCHIEKVEPILEGLAASKVVAKVITWVGGVIIGIGAIYTLFKQFVHL